MDMFLASCLSGTFGPRIVHCSFLTGTLGMGRGGHGSGQRLSPSFDLRKLLGGLPVSVFEGLEIMVNPFPHRNHHFYCLNPFCLMLKPQPQHLDNGLGIDKWSTEHRDDCCILQRQRSGLDVASVAPWWADFEHKYGDFTKNFMVI